jgi:DNA-binding NtrC family response regulator
LKKILIVDDEKGMRSLLRSLLEGFSLDIREAVDGAQAWEIASSEEFDLVISDYAMPKLDGRALLARCREHMPAMPFIMVSGYFQKSIEERDNVFLIAKPFSLDHLVGLVERILGMKYLQPVQV